MKVLRFVTVLVSCAATPKSASLTCSFTLFESAVILKRVYVI